MTIERALVGTTDATAAASVYVEDVFSTYLYSGTGASQTITNGIDLSTKGGMVWVKGRSGATDHALYDTARGATYDIGSNLTTAQTTQSTGLTAFGNSGYTIGALAKLNTSAATYTSFAFRKQAKFFDVVTFSTGTANSNRRISHSLGVAPGMIIVKATDKADDWYVYHKTLGRDAIIRLNTTAASQAGTSAWTSSDPTSTDFGFNETYFGAAGASFVAYLFADSNSGGFGAAGTDSVVACGSYTGNGSATGPSINLGWEPQFVLVKMSSSTGSWNMFDNMRGIPTGSADPYLFANTSAAEATTNGDLIDLTPTGFTIKSTNAQVNTSSGTYIYLAIRRGPMKTPTDATKVFAPIKSNSTIGTSLTTGFPVDAQIIAPNADVGDKFVVDRLRGVNPNADATNTWPYLTTDKTNAEVTSSVSRTFSNTGYQTSLFFAGLSIIYWNFRRAPGFFDVVCYTGTGANRTVAHNLGVAPELMIVKQRNGMEAWYTYSVTTGPTKYLVLNTIAKAEIYNLWNDTSPTSSVFSLGNVIEVNRNTYTHVAYLFATCPGVSKCGSYTGSGTTKQIDCGFAAGARFVLIKRTDSTGDWYVWDTARGLVSGNDPYLLLNSTAAEVTNTDYIDPYSAGFEISSSAPAAINASGGTFIYLAIA